MWVGANALLVYLGAAAGVLDAGLALLYYGSPENNIVDLAQRTLFGGSDVLLVLVRIHCRRGRARPGSSRGRARGFWAAPTDATSNECMNA